MFVLGGVGIAGLAVFGTFGIIGLDQRSSLDNCKPGCSEAQLDDGGRRSFLIADVALGIGAASLVAATIIYLTRPTADPRPSARVTKSAHVPWSAIEF